MQMKKNDSYQNTSILKENIITCKIKWLSKTNLAYERFTRHKKETGKLNEEIPFGCNGYCNSKD